jgi:hypothetical protein
MLATRIGRLSCFFSNTTLSASSTGMAIGSGREEAS